MIGRLWVQLYPRPDCKGLSMWALHHRHQWTDIDTLEEPSDSGRLLEVGGFVLADSFETFLQSISENYLRNAWRKLSIVLSSRNIFPTDLSWGYMHPGETYVKGYEQKSPMSYIGWISRQLARFDLESEYVTIDQLLQQDEPKIRCATTWRSSKWDIKPENYMLALKLVEAICTDELIEWFPEGLLDEQSDATQLWLRVAKSIKINDQDQLNDALIAAKKHYSPLGYKIMLKAYTVYVDTQPSSQRLRLPYS